MMKTTTTTTFLSEAYKDTPPISPKHIIPLDFNSVQTLPDSHVWPHHEQQNLNNNQSSIPIIDLNDPDRVESIRHACENWGVFQILNHGVSPGLLRDVEAQARALFALPANQKVKALRSPGGATGYGSARISPFFSKFMWHEGFTIMGSPVDHARKLWPHEYESFCDVMDEYQKKMKTLAYQLFLLILISLAASEEDVKSLYESEGALQINSYPRCPDPTRAMGLAPHTDSLFLTILHQSDTNGLEIFRECHDDEAGGLAVGRWIPVCPAEGALVVNVGDLLHILSNGRFRSVRHRAVVNQTRHRISVAYFYGPPLDSEIGPFANNDNDSNNNSKESSFFPRYKTLSAKEYISIKAKHLDEALSFIRIN